MVWVCFGDYLCSQFFPEWLWQETLLLYLSSYLQVPPWVPARGNILIPLILFIFLVIKLCRPPLSGPAALPVNLVSFTCLKEIFCCFYSPYGQFFSLCHIWFPNQLFTSFQLCFIIPFIPLIFAFLPVSPAAFLSPIAFRTSSVISPHHGGELSLTQRRLPAVAVSKCCTRFLGTSCRV